jgi:ATP-dependent DNA helicase RecG
MDNSGIIIDYHQLLGMNKVETIKNWINNKIHEVIKNAIIHRDYSISGSDIKIAIYNSRIDVVSPGGLPKTITVDEIYAGRSEIRNKVITRIFREADIIEQWGSGIPRIREACEQEGLKLP